MKLEQLDPRGPRFGAGISSILMLIVIYLSLDPASEAIALGVMGFAVVMFTFGSILGPARHPYSYLYKYTLRKFLKAPAYLEPATPVHFAQVIGLVITGLGLTLGLLGIPYALPIAAAAAFMAAFVNAVFAYCIGCQMYLGLKRLGTIR
ncbi:MAG: DUF4395 family protein [Actinobacteria bacterium]|jgi:hypothetical protein|uniref:Unannotated protein n=1 Tax=freshwater metagenome TaxID=449393 RepID=A0A6J6HPJ7_9ZZZZ|nr:DUF4395 family protein [Actinomycetota bacterium]